MSLLEFTDEVNKASQHDLLYTLSAGIDHIHSGRQIRNKPLKGFLWGCSHLKALSEFYMLGLLLSTLGLSDDTP
jgi:hypothetical protein